MEVLAMVRPTTKPAWPTTWPTTRRTDLTGRRVLVTGGGSGIGRQVVLRSARCGADVVVWDRDEAAALAVRDEVRAHGRRAEHAVVDVTDEARVAAAAEATQASGPVDVLVNNAGVVTGRRLLDADPAAIRRTFEVNTLALYWTTRAFLPGMAARDRGTVVTVASAAGLVGVARQTDYAASKAAAVGFTESLRAELRADGSHVRTLLVCPYYIDTGMFAGVRTKVPLLLPILHEGDVGERIVAAIASGRQQLLMPPLVHAVPMLRALPVPVFDAVADLFGINRSMDHFTGRATPR
jgi:all-trans-retinol dehydrogenase (NAD+)